VALDRSRLPYEVLIIYAEFAGAWALGEFVRHHRRESAEQAARVELERDRRAREAAAAERGRIARELHDVVSHSLSVIAVQAGAARIVMHSAPERLSASLLAIETVSREAWAEVRQFLDLAGRDAGSGEPPRSGLAHLPDLIERFEWTGLTVDLVVTGEAQPLPADADLCAYRVVQESLTNTLRHGGRRERQARVSISYGDGSVEVEIADDDRGGRAPGAHGQAGNGHHGLAGMSERVRLAGGELSVEDGGRGFVVRALLPVTAAAS
jgi:signal transduction histidine kinase